MCGRYRLKRGDARELALLLGRPELEITLSAPDAARWNIAPQEKTPPPIVYRPAADLPPQVTQSMPWGITLPDRLLINAKMESASVHKANLSARRCIVPAHGYYEWFATALPGAKGKPLKIPFVLSLPEDRTFYFAGLWGSNVRQTALGSNGFVIMTGEPPKSIAWLHNRMPLVVPADCIEDWLNPRLPYDQVREMLNDVILKYSHELEWEVKPITPLPSGRNASDIPEPFALPWWRASMGQVLAAIYNWRGERAAQTEELQAATEMPLNALEDDLHALTEKGMLLNQDGWKVPVKGA